MNARKQDENHSQSLSWILWCVSLISLLGFLGPIHFSSWCQPLKDTNWVLENCSQKKIIALPKVIALGQPTFNKTSTWQYTGLAVWLQLAQLWGDFRTPDLFLRWASAFCTMHFCFPRPFTHFGIFHSFKGIDPKMAQRSSSMQIALSAWFLDNLDQVHFRAIRRWPSYFWSCQKAEIKSTCDSSTDHDFPAFFYKQPDGLLSVNISLRLWVL